MGNLFSFDKACKFTAVRIGLLSNCQAVFFLPGLQCLNMYCLPSFVLTQSGFLLRSKALPSLSISARPCSSIKWLYFSFCLASHPVPHRRTDTSNSPWALFYSFKGNLLQTFPGMCFRSIPVRIVTENRREWKEQHQSIHI